jgi:predicted dehydrogenase
MTGSPAHTDPVRVGLLGAARITVPALVEPAREGGVRLVAIAARDRVRAEAFASLHAVDTVLDRYADVIGCAEVEAVYNALPNGWHGPWNLAAIAAGKHLLAEKPFASNAEEAVEVAAAARRGDVVVMEAFHYTYHPVARRMREILASGELGQLRHVETIFQIPSPEPDDLRWSLPLAGGASMDVGCYCLHAQRSLAGWAGGEPVVVTARARELVQGQGVDESIEAELRFPSGATGRVRYGMVSDVRRATWRIVGTNGEALAMEFVNPQLDDRVIVTGRGTSRVEHPGIRPTYAYQLESFVDAVRHGAPVPTDVDDSIATMRLIDQCYLAAGLPLRPRSTVPDVVTEEGG